MKKLTLCSMLLLGALLAPACDKGETREDPAPSSQPSSAPDAKADAGPAAPPDAAAPAPEVKPSDAPPVKAEEVDHHAGFDALLQKFVNEQGGVSYQAWKADAASLDALNKYVAWVESADPSKMDDKARLAFYINAYNAITLKAVLERYPNLKSVLDVKGFFDAIQYKVAGEMMTLNQLEGDKIRKPFGEPRIHFVVNCASASCPILRRAAITPANLEASLEEGARAYVLQETKVNAKKKTVDTSKIFEWYKDDFAAFEFGGVKGVNAFLAKYLPADQAEAAKTAKVTTHDYLWNLNEAKEK
jgi:hypothetical protein